MPSSPSRRWVLAAAALLLLTITTVGALSTPYQRSIYFESHGRDDLREWPAALVKGAQYIKIDFNFIDDPWTCAVQRRLVAQQPNRSLTPPEMFPNGCFVLAHYYANFTLDFNTTGDLITLMKQPSMREYLAGPRRIVPQLCFKSKPFLCPTKGLAAHWVALMDAFYQEATAVVAQHGLNVQFVFDSLALEESCAFTRWPLWPSTWVGDERTAVNNSKTLHYDEFQMVNMHYIDNRWEWLLEHNYYKFVNNSYAFIGWEPDLQYSVDAFLRPLMEKGPLHSAGLITAYNNDPSMFHVYTANLTGQHSNLPVGSPATLSSKSSYLDAWGILVTCSVLQRNGTECLIECTALQRSQNARFDAVSTSVSAWIPIDDLKAIQVMPVLSSDVNGTRLVLIGSRAFVVSMLQCTNATTTVSCEVLLSTTFEPWTTFSKVNLDDFIVDVGAAPSQLLISDTWFYIATARLAKAPPHSIVVDVWQVGLHSHDIDPIMGDVIMTNNAYGNSTYANSSQLPSDASLNVALHAELNGISVITSWAMDRHTYAALIDTRVGTVVPHPDAAPVVVGIGRNPAAFLLGDTIGMSFDTSFCFNSELVDDDILLFWGEKECDLRDSNIFELAANPVLAYVYGPLSAFSSRLAAGNHHLHGFATVCDAELLHGAFDLGYTPSTLLLPKDSDRFQDDSIQPGSHWFVTTATSLTEVDLLCMCGSPDPHHGRTVVDAFPLRGFYNESAAMA